MTASDSTAGKTGPRNSTTDEKFNAQHYLETTLKRRPHELMTVVRIPESDAFRVNWYAIRPDQTSAIAGMSIRYIRESQFLFCRLDANGKPCIVFPTRQ